MAAAEITIVPFLYKVNAVVINPVIKLVFAIAIVIFFYGIYQFISEETGDKGREQGKKKILWGLVGMLIMFSAYGIINLILGTFNFPKPGILP
ncbi:MAG: hypothetical protein WAV25_01775 [Minisyncoccia bacterium]